MRRTGRPDEAQPVERLRAGHLVEEVEVDVEQVRLALRRVARRATPTPSRPAFRPSPHLHHGPPVGRSHDICDARATAVRDRRCRPRFARDWWADGRASQALRRQYQDMDNTSGVGVLDKAAIVLERPRGRPVDPRAARHGHRPGPPDGPPARRRPRAPPPRHPRPAGPLRPRPAARRARRRRRRGPPARRGRPRARRAARPHERERPALPPPGRAAGLRLGRRAPGRPARLHPGRRDAVDARRAPPRRCCSPGRSPTGCTAACRAPPSRRPPCRASAAAAGRRASASASPASRRCPRRCAAPPAGSSPPCRSPGPIERLSRQPGRLHAATVIAGANKLTEVLARHAAQQDQQNNA